MPKHKMNRADMVEDARCSIDNAASLLSCVGGDLESNGYAPLAQEYHAIYDQLVALRAKLENIPR